MYPIRALMIIVCLSLVGAQAHGQTDAAVPARHYIEGVPFVGWGEAADLNYPNKDILNPSYPAASQMVWRYWGVRLDASTGWPVDEIKKGAYLSVDKASLDDLRRHVALDRPVEIWPAITAHAHFLYITIKLMAKFSKDADYDLEQPGPTSGLLDEMVSIDDFMHAVSRGCPKRMINDSVFIAARVVVGYDDTRQIVIIHDPVFGPDWEVSYDDFLQMWRFADNAMAVPTFDEVGFERQPDEQAHPVRTADHDAAFALINGYSLAAVNRLAAAEAELRRGLALEGASMRYQHLLRLELGSLLGKTKRREEAIRLLREAVDIYPDYFRAWGELGNVYQTYRNRESQRNARKAFDAMNKLCTTEIERRVAKDLGQDYYVRGCEGAKLGWYQP